VAALRALYGRCSSVGISLVYGIIIGSFNTAICETFDDSAGSAAMWKNNRTDRLQYQVNQLAAVQEK
jgi:hypothetical protein